MINPLIQAVFLKINQNIKLTQQSHFLKRCRRLCLPVQQNMPKQMIVFKISQYILALIDRHVTQKNQHKKRQEKWSLNVKNKKQNQFQKQKTSGFLQLAVLIYRTFCDSQNLQSDKDIQAIHDIQKLVVINQEQIAIEIFQLRQNIQFVEDFKNMFKCHCNQKEILNFKTCECCFRRYHPECQGQKLVCNSCFMKFYMFPLQNKFTNPFGGNKDIQTYFCGHITTKRPQINKITVFHLIKFDLKDLLEIKNSNDKQIILKIKNCRKIEPNVNQNHKKKTKAELLKKKCHIFSLDDTSFQLFFNYYKIKNRQILFKSQNCIILKIEPFRPHTHNNILIVKTQTQPGYGQTNQYMVGVYKISKISKKSTTTNQQNFLLNKSITINQSLTLKNFSNSKQINHNMLSQQFVRSYGCDHYQKFNLTKLKESIKNRIGKNNVNQKQDSGQNVQSIAQNIRITRKSRLNRQNRYLQCPICSKSLFILHYDPHSFSQQVQTNENQNSIQIQSEYTSQINLSFDQEIQKNQQQESVKEVPYINLESLQSGEILIQKTDHQNHQNHQNHQSQRNENNQQKQVIQIDSQ